MHKKKLFYLSLIVVAVAVAISIFAVQWYIDYNKDFSSILSTVGYAKSYEQKSDIGYLTLDHESPYGKRDLIVKVEDVNLQNILSESNLADYIGANMRFTIPAKILREKNIEADYRTFNPFELLYPDDEFDKYLILLEVFF